MKELYIKTSSDRRPDSYNKPHVLHYLINVQDTNERGDLSTSICSQCYHHRNMMLALRTHTPYLLYPYDLWVSVIQHCCNPNTMGYCGWGCEHNANHLGCAAPLPLVSGARDLLHNRDKMHKTVILIQRIKMCLCINSLFHTPVLVRFK